MKTKNEIKAEKALAKILKLKDKAERARFEFEDTFDAIKENKELWEEVCKIRGAVVDSDSGDWLA